MLIRNLFLLAFLVAQPFFAAAEMRTTCSSNTSAASEREDGRKRQQKLKWIPKRFRSTDRLAIWSVCLTGVTVLATLATFIIEGGFAAGFALAFSGVFALAGIILGLIALIRAMFKGWRRGTFWAILAIGIPLVFLLASIFGGCAK